METQPQKPSPQYLCLSVLGVICLGSQKHESQDQGDAERELPSQFRDVGFDELFDFREWNTKEIHISPQVLTSSSGPSRHLQTE